MTRSSLVESYRTFVVHLVGLENPVTTCICPNIDKCSFGMNKIQYLGYIRDEHGVHMDPTKIQVIQDLLALVTLIKIHRFFGLANFY